MNSILEIKEGTQYQSAGETLYYKITTTNWASDPGSTAAVVYDESDSDTVVTDTVMGTGAVDETGDVITLKPLKSLTKNHTYRIEVAFTCGSNIYECWFRVRCLI